MPEIRLTVLPEVYAIHRLHSGQTIPSLPEKTELFSLTHTADEVSLVCSTEIDITAEKSESDWKCFKILGPLDFSLTGILAKISGHLAQKEISIFALSTYDTDYILVKSNMLTAAINTLKDNNYIIV